MNQIESNHLAGFQKFWFHKPAKYSFIILLGIILVVVLAPLFPNYQPNDLTDQIFHPPSFQHWLGTDDHGRDIWSRTIFGARISILVGFVGAFVSFIIGTIWGIIAGYFGGQTDQLMMRFVDILYSLPSIIFVIVLLTSLKEILLTTIAGQWTTGHEGWVHFILLFVGLGAVSWLTLARIVRGQVKSLMCHPFIESCQSLGLSHTTIIAKHLIPNLMGIIITYVMLSVPSVILYESFLSFLGLGIESPMASLGSLIAKGVPQINPIRIYWWLIAFPTITLAIILVCLNLVGDGLRYAFDPHSGKTNSN